MNGPLAAEFGNHCDRDPPQIAQLLGYAGGFIGRYLRCCMERVGSRSEKAVAILWPRRGYRLVFLQEWNAESTG